MHYNKVKEISKSENKGWWVMPPKERKDIINPPLIVDCFVGTPGADPKPIGWVKQGDGSHQQEGINPMATTNTCVAPTAIASIAVPSDEMKKVEYLNNRARAIDRKISYGLREMFHFNGPSQPRYYKELIDAIKNDEYTINEKYAARADEAWKEFQDEGDRWFDYNVFYGIDFTKFPDADYAGYDKALRELADELQKVQDIIAIMPALDALKAVQDFETWKPSNAPTVQ